MRKATGFGLKPFKTTVCSSMHREHSLVMREISLRIARLAQSRGRRCPMSLVHCIFKAFSRGTLLTSEYSKYRNKLSNSLFDLRSKSTAFLDKCRSDL